MPNRRTMIEKSEPKVIETESQSFSNAQLKTDDLPRWEDIEYEPLAKAAPWEPFWQTSIMFMIIFTVIVISFFAPFIPLFISLIALVAMLFIFAILQWHNFAGHKVRGVALREMDIVFRKGLFWQRSTLLPFNRVQHIEIHRNPFERKLGLSSLRIFTAGGSGVDLQISGLENERAERIKQFILEKSKKDSVEK